MGVTRIRLVRSAAALASIAAVALVAPAAASNEGPLPRPQDPTIVPGSSLGGVSIGQPMAAAEAAWGNPGKCRRQGRGRSCNFTVRNRGFGALTAIDGKVALAGFNAWTRHGEVVAKGPLMEFGTAKGDLGLGDKLTRIAKRYPNGKLERGKKAIVWSLVFREDGNVMTFSSTDRKHRRVTAISILDPSL
jgi:hypothetical protein